MWSRISKLYSNSLVLPVLRSNTRCFSKYSMVGGKFRDIVSSIVTDRFMSDDTKVNHIHNCFIHSVITSSHVELNMVKKDMNQNMFERLMLYFKGHNIDVEQRGRYKNIISIKLKNYSIKLKLCHKTGHRMIVFDHDNMFISDTEFKTSDTDDIAMHIVILENEC